MSWAEIYPWRAPEPGAPVARHVYDQVREAIVAGALPPGGRLPSSRDLAVRLGVARASVTSAYDLLLAEGYAVGRPGSGTYVSDDLSGLAELNPTPTAKAAPPKAPARARAFEALAYPLHDPEPRLFNSGRTQFDARAADAFSRSIRKTLRHLGHEHFGYGDARGDEGLRACLAEYLRATRGVICEPEQMIVTSGAQPATDMALRVLLRPGDAVWMEDPGYNSTRHALEAAGLEVHPIPVDRSGVVVEQGMAAAPKARAAFVTPSHQYPLGVTLSMARRMELLAWARQADAWIVEDDYSSEYRYSGPPLNALQGLDGGDRVIYVGTLNKALFPGLRMGYLIAPKSLMPALTNARHLIDRQPSSLVQAVVHDFMREGHFAAHIRRRRMAYAAQRDVLVETLRARLGHHLEVEVPDGGIHLIAWLKDGRPDLEVEAACAGAGLTVRAMSRLYIQAPPRQGLQLGFTGFPSRSFAAGVARLAAVLEAPSAGRRRDIG